MEGHDIAAGTTDVVVTDGFTGNVALKTGEGALKLIGDLLRQVFRSSLAARWPICWRGRRWTGCANGSIRAATTAR